MRDEERRAQAFVERERCNRTPSFISALAAEFRTIRSEARAEALRESAEVVLAMDPTNGALRVLRNRILALDSGSKEGK